MSLQEEDRGVGQTICEDRVAISRRPERGDDLQTGRWKIDWQGVSKQTTSQPEGDRSRMTALGDGADLAFCLFLHAPVNA